jgi:hypothetical protein
MAAPAVGTYPVMTLRTPSGMPAAYLDYQKYFLKKKPKTNKNTTRDGNMSTSLVHIIL